MGWSACGLFWANRHHLELNWTELFAIHQILYERPSQWIWSMDWETTFYYISLKLYSSLLYMFRQTFFFFFFKWHSRHQPQEHTTVWGGKIPNRNIQQLGVWTPTSWGVNIPVWGGNILLPHAQCGVGTYPSLAWEHTKYLKYEHTTSWVTKYQMHEIAKYITAWEHTTVWGEHTTAWGGNIPQFWVETYQTGTDHNLGWQNTKQEHTTVCGVNIPQFRVGTNHILGWQNIKQESATVWGGKIPDRNIQQFWMQTYHSLGWEWSSMGC